MRPGQWSRPLVSALVTVTDTPGPIVQLYQVYARTLRESGWPFEFVFAVEPLHAGLVPQLLELQAAGEPVRVLEVGQSAGASALLRLAAGAARGEFLLTLPAQWRVEPSAIPHLLTRLIAGADLVLARRWPRSDAWVNRLQNRAFHTFVRWSSGAPLHDLACGVRAFRPELLEEVPLYGDFHRFFPLFADQAGFRVEEISAAQHPGDRDPRVYSLTTYLSRVLDLLGLFFLLRFTQKPLRFFGFAGAGSALTGLAVLIVLLAQRLGGQGIADRPLLLVGVLLLALGVQAIALGLVGEIMVFLHAPERPAYRLARECEAEILPGPEEPEPSAEVRVPAEAGR